jgi:uncharacterized secreted repeat protein (TIGR03808 family)
MHAMPIDRRSLLIGSLSGAAALTVPISAYGLDAAQLGVRPGAQDDQSRALQRAIDQAARTRVPLILMPGVYRAGDLKLPDGAQLLGVRGATRFVLTRGPSLLSGEAGDHITISGLVLDGDGQPLRQNRGLVHLVASKSIRISDCEFARAGGNAIVLERCEGQVTANSITAAADNAILCNDNFGVIISSNIIRDSGNGGIRVWQSVKRHDGSVVADNTIDDTEARAGGTGENGNAINVFRAANVIVRNNIIRRAAFSAIRGNAAANIQIIGNNCASLKETALYSEFDFEGAVVANNVIDTAENGISVTNFNNGGRLATVHGNLIRNIGVQRPGTAPEDAGIGIGIEAETAVTGNVVESAAQIGIRAGWGPYLRNVTVSGNVVRNSSIGIAVSVAPKAGNAVVSGNIIAGAQFGAVVAMEWAKVVSGDLTKDGAARYPQLAIDNNQAR